MEKVYLCTQIVRERAAPRQRASSLHSVCTVLDTRVVTTLLFIAQFLSRTATSKEILRAKPYVRWRVRFRRRLLRRT